MKISFDEFFNWWKKDDDTMMRDITEVNNVKRKVFIHHTAVVYPGVQIEDDVEIGPFCVIGKNPQFKDRNKAQNVGRVIIRSGARLEGLLSVDSGSKGFTEIGPNAYLMKDVHVGHDCKIGADVVLSPGANLAGFATIGDRTNLGMGVQVHQYAAIPERCMIGMGAVVTKKAAANMKPGETWAGNPARRLGLNKKWVKQ